MQLPKILILDGQNPLEGVREWTPPEVPDFAGPTDLANCVLGMGFVLELGSQTGQVS